MFPHRRPRLKPRSLFLAACLVTLLSLAAFSAAQGNSGTIKVKDDIDVVDEPGQGGTNRNEPHVEGDVYVEGFNMAAEEGTLNFYSWPPTGDGELILATTWEADGGEPANHFIAGPFFFECGHYRVEAQNGMEEDDFPGGVKSKMFWVDCPDEGEPEPEPECPSSLIAIANEDGSVTLEFEPAAGSDGTNVYRAVDDGDFEYLDTVGPGVGTYTDDDDLELGETYTYTVTALFGDEESTNCDEVEVTVIPVFPTALGFGMASVLGIGAYAFAMRRRKD